MEIKPLECGFCDKPIIVGQMAQMIIEDGFNFVIHSANKERFVTWREPKEVITASCLEAKKRGAI